MSPIEELTAIAREFGKHDVLEVARQMLPASDYDELVSRVKEASRVRLGRVGGGASSHLPVQEAYEARLPATPSADEWLEENMAGDFRDMPAAS